MVEYERLKALIEEEREKNRQATATWAEHINTISRLRREAQMREQELGAFRAILAALREPSEDVVEAAAARIAAERGISYPRLKSLLRKEPGQVIAKTEAEGYERFVRAALSAALEAAEREAAAKDAGHA